ncbi:hypothetical protein BJX62DRAFT_212120 [Aspergillus germanicus]
MTGTTQAMKTRLHGKPTMRPTSSYHPLPIPWRMLILGQAATGMALRMISARRALKTTRPRRESV